jgi:hypothetical protein
MTLQDLNNIYNHRGYDVALAVLEDAKLPGADEYRLQEALETWEAEKLRRWTHPSRYPAAYDPHQF